MHLIKKDLLSSTYNKDRITLFLGREQGIKTLCFLMPGLKVNKLYKEYFVLISNLDIQIVVKLKMHLMLKF